MKRFRSIGLLIVVLGLTACADDDEDDELRVWATAVDDTLQRMFEFNQNVYKGLVALCALEQNVYDNFHGGQTPNPAPVRYCAKGDPSDPVPPPPPPKDWDE